MMIIIYYIAKIIASFKSDKVLYSLNYKNIAPPSHLKNILNFSSGL